MIKAVLFDMDGVLIDAKDWHYEALNKALQLFGYEITRNDHLSTFDGLPTKVKLDIISQRYPLPAQLHSFINEMKQIYTYELVHALCKPRFQHEYALSKLKQLGYKTAVASNSIRHTVELMMEKSNLKRFLDLQVSNEDVKNAKPSPEIYQYCMSKFGLQPNECLVVEDNPNGIAAARASGAHVLEVAGVDDVSFAHIMNRIHSLESATQ